MSFKQIWFDFDGTLAVANEKYDAAHDELRYKVYAEVLGKELNNTLRREYEMLYQNYHSNSAIFRSLGMPDGYWIDQLEAADMSAYYEHREDVPAVIEKLRERAVLGVFTNNKRAPVERTLERLGIAVEFFSELLTGDLLEERKPALSGFKMMLKLADCAPDELLYVGDRINVDVNPARSLGIKTALVWNEDEKADFSCPEFTDLLKVVN